MERFLRIFPWACTLILVGLGLYQIIMRQVETKVYWDPKNAAGMVVPGTFDKPLHETAQSAPVPTAETIDSCVNGFRGDENARQSDVVGKCCGTDSIRGSLSFRECAAKVLSATGG